MPQPATITGSGDQLVLDPAQNNAFRLINRALAAGGTVRFDARLTGAQTGGARYVVAGVDAPTLDRWASEFWVGGERMAAASTSAAATVPTRIALYKAAPGNIDEGWTEWLLDHYKIPYTILHNKDFDGSELRGSSAMGYSGQQR